MFLRGMLFSLALLSLTANALPNPAYVYCVDNGGMIETRADKDGNQFGICMFDQDGARSECNQWEFLRGECAPGEGLYWSVDTRKCEMMP